jgi:hypothetical protein
MHQRLLKAEFEVAHPQYAVDGAFPGVVQTKVTLGWVDEAGSGW